MKDLSEIIVTEVKLKLLIGIDLKYIFPVIKAKGKKDKKQPVSLQTILNAESKDHYGNSTQTSLFVVNSFDKRFDKKHPINLAIDYIREKGIRKDLLSKIYADPRCIRCGKLMGNYAVFNDILSPEQLEVIHTRLKLELKQQTERRERAENFFK